ncbi:MAG: hypothetical protein WCO64_00035 [Actinomycetes bacterium]
MAAKILVVCAANVCRSPYTAAVFHNRLSADPHTAALGLIIESAGTEAYLEQNYCDYAKKRIDLEPNGMSRHVDTVDLQPFDLILTMTIKQRSELVRTMPSRRSGIYTLVEAARQAHGVVQSGQALDVARGIVSPDETIGVHHAVSLLPGTNSQRWEWLLDEMNASRGAFSGEVAQHHTLDIDDPHGSTKDIHDKTYKSLEKAVSSFVQALSATLSA